MWISYAFSKQRILFLPEEMLNKASMPQSIGKYVYACFILKKTWWKYQRLVSQVK